MKKHHDKADSQPGCLLHYDNSQFSVSMIHLREPLAALSILIIKSGIKQARDQAAQDAAQDDAQDDAD